MVVQVKFLHTQLQCIVIYGCTLQLKAKKQLIFYSHLLLKYYFFVFFLPLPDSSDPSTLSSVESHHPLTTASPPPKLNYHRPTLLPHAIDPRPITDLLWLIWDCWVCFCVMACGEVGIVVVACWLLGFFFLVELATAMIVIMGVNQWVVWVPIRLWWAISIDWLVFWGFFLLFFFFPPIFLVVSWWLGWF